MQPTTEINGAARAPQDKLRDFGDEQRGHGLALAMIKEAFLDPDLERDLTELMQVRWEEVKRKESAAVVRGFVAFVDAYSRADPGDAQSLRRNLLPLMVREVPK